MKFILKIFLAPLMLVLWIIECVCKLALKPSSVVFVLLSILFVVAGIYHFANGSTLNGCIGLAIAFLLSPCWRSSSQPGLSSYGCCSKKEFTVYGRVLIEKGVDITTFLCYNVKGVLK